MAHDRVDDFAGGAEVSDLGQQQNAAVVEEVRLGGTGDRSGGAGPDEGAQAVALDGRTEVIAGRGAPAVGEDDQAQAEQRDAVVGPVGHAVALERAEVAGDLAVRERAEQTRHLARRPAAVAAQVEDHRLRLTLQLGDDLVGGAFEESGQLDVLDAAGRASSMSPPDAAL